VRKKKIAICQPQVPFVYGGAEIHAESLRRELIKRGFLAEIISVPYKWYPNEQLMQSMINWRMIDLSESNGDRIDLVIPMKFPSYGVKHENKVVWLIHQFRQAYDLLGTKYSDFDGSPESQAVIDLVKRFDHNALSESKRLYTTSKNNAQRLRRFNDLSAEVLYHPPQHIGKYFFDGIGDFVLSVGRLDVLKRIDILIRAMQKTGPERENLEKLATKLGLEDRVKFLGFVDDEELLKLYASCMAVYYAPFDEDYGYITLESFFSKKTILSFKDSGGVLEFVNESNGFIVSEEEEISQNINYLYFHKERAKQMGEEGYQIVKNITWDSVIDRLTETIR